MMVIIMMIYNFLSCLCQLQVFKTLGTKSKALFSVLMCMQATYALLPYKVNSSTMARG